MPRVVVFVDVKGLVDGRVRYVLNTTELGGQTPHSPP